MLLHAACARLGLTGRDQVSPNLHAKMRGSADSDAVTLYAAHAHPAALPARLWAVGWVGARRVSGAMDSPCIFSEWQGHAGATESGSCSLCRTGTYLTGSGLHRRWEGVLKSSSVWRHIDES